MKRTSVGIRLAVVCALATACAAETGDHVGKKSAAASGTPLHLSTQSLPMSVYPDTGVYFWQGVYNDDTVTVHNDVTLTITIAGAADVVKLNFENAYDKTWSCTQVAGKSVTITCHADTVQFKDQVNFTALAPSTAGNISFDSLLTEGGVVVDKFHADVAVGVASGADLGVYAFGGFGDVPVGQTVGIPFSAYNSGPQSATGATLTFTLKGPGKFVDPKAPPPLPPPPDPKMPPPPVFPSSPCTFTDTTGTCTIGDMAVFSSSMFNVLVETTDVGVVTVTGSIAANESDPSPWNNSATSSFTVFKPVVADLSVTMSAAPDPVVFKKPLTYTIVVSNKGPDAASGATLNDFLPSDLTFESVTTTQGSCFGSDYGFLDCKFGPIAAGASATVTLVATPTEGGTITNSVWVNNQKWMENDPDYTNNYATTTTEVRGPNPPVTTTSNQQKFPVTYFAYVPCANDFVILSGTTHYSTHTIFNESSGRYQYESLSNPQGLSGTGLNSGASYVSTGMVRSSQTFTGGYPTSFDYVDNYRLISKGPGPDLLVHIVNHVTFDSGWMPKVSISKYSYECK